MKFKIAKNEFLNILQLSSRALSSTTPLPILSGIKISVTDNSLTLISSDSNISIKTCINNNDTNTLIINEPGEIVIDGKFVVEMVRRLDGDFINFEIIDGNLIKIYDDKAEYKINGIEVSEYPNISFDITDNNPFKLETTLFNQIIDETAFACAESDTKQVLTGVNFKADNNKLYANATDSFRLASKTININENLNFNITVPAKYLSEIYHSISNEKEITIAIDNQKISFLFGNTIITTRLLDNDFPDVSKLIPTNYLYKLKISSKELLKAVDKTMIIKTDGKNAVKLKINSSELEVTSSNLIGSSHEIINIISFEGDELEISCSGKYLQDALKAIGNDEVVINFSGELRPFVVQKEGDDSLIQLISPKRTYN